MTFPLVAVPPARLMLLLVARAPVVYCPALKTLKPTQRLRNDKLGTVERHAQFCR
jgi:hypothetical protein